jgi:hypothetical protein
MRTRRRGFFISDAILGLAILVMIATALAIAAGRQNTAARKLANSRSAARMAERALVAMQSRTPVEASPSVKVERLADASPAKGYTWVQVTATVEGRRALLIGLAPDQGGAR